MRVRLSNLGCKLNQAEIEQLARALIAAGHRVVPDLLEADVHVVNSCTVTHVAARDSRKTARRPRRKNPTIRTVLTGCYVDGSPEEAASLAGVDLVVPNRDKDDLVARIEAAFPDLAPQTTQEPSRVLPYMQLEHGNTRALVKIEDGCNMPCTFCIIPTTRGGQRSRPLAEVVSQVRGLAQVGYQEAVITGVQISSYRDRGRGLYELVCTLLDRTSIPRLRLTSIAPWQFDDRILDLFESGRLCRHFHLSLQSGCDATLERMRRFYSTGSFAALARSIRERLPGVALTTDVIVGFPGETDVEFQTSLDFTRNIGFARIHAFPYSSRPGTVAADLGDQVTYGAKRQRMRAMLAAADEAEGAFLDAQLGSTVEVLWERLRGGRWLGMSDNYIRTYSPQPQLENSFTTVRLSRRVDDGIGIECTRQHRPAVASGDEGFSTTFQSPHGG